ncbi:hypothetical protein [Nonomuraea sp. B12E4]|uniref:hypothetical protein n=1 Tax=Nonomuraea sp. B12E4 TaxID=3153564 RepID=UPI00325FCBFC
MGLARSCRVTLDSLEHLVGGMGTGILALVTLLSLVVTALTCLVGVGARSRAAESTGARLCSAMSRRVSAQPGSACHTRFGGMRPASTTTAPSGRRGKNRPRSQLSKP